VASFVPILSYVTTGAVVGLSGSSSLFRLFGPAARGSNKTNRINKTNLFSSRFYELYGMSRLICMVIVESTRTLPDSRRFLLLALPFNRCRRPALCRTIFPLPVRWNRFFTPL
jgi:hypothetical protein